MFFIVLLLLAGCEIKEANQAPVAADGALTTTEDVPANSRMTASDVDGDTLMFSVLADGAIGTVTLNDALTGEYTYTPDMHAHGVDSFSFQVSDGTAESNVAKVSISILSVNDLPVAMDQSVETKEDSPIGAVLEGSDAEGDPLVFRIVENGAIGTATIDDSATGSFIYTPDPDSYGEDQFTYKVSDGTGDSPVATVSVGIVNVNDLPVAMDQSIETDADSAISAMLIGSDKDGDPLVFRIIENGAIGAATIDDSAMGSFTYTPDPGSYGEDHFTFLVSDGTAVSNVATVSVNIARVLTNFTDITDPVLFPRYSWEPGGAFPVRPHPVLTWADWDGDGDLDLPGYRNDTGAFTDVLDQMGTYAVGPYRGAVWADYDSDGDLDMVALAHNGSDYRAHDVLYRNNGDGTFVDIAPPNGMDFDGQGETAAWADYDGDGDVDLLVPNYSCSFLWRNDGNDIFEDVLAATGIDLCTLDNNAVRPEGVTFFDYNRDGWLDLYGRGVLSKNLGDGTFADVTLDVGGLRHLAHDEGFTPVDLDNDGDFDLSIYYRTESKIELFEFDAATEKYRLRLSMPVPGGLLGPVWADMDNDGDLDALCPVYKDSPVGAFWFQNDGDWNFIKVVKWLKDAGGSYIDYPSVFASFGDYDADGDLDIILADHDQSDPSDLTTQARLIRNDLDPTGGYIRVRVTDSQRHMNQFGATVLLKKLSDGSVQTRYVDGGTNWTQSQYDVHFGVDDTAMYELTVVFPRRQGLPVESVDPSTDPSLRLSPQLLADRTIVITRP